VLFAMLCGGDYDTKGLPGCGTALAKRVVQAGLGASLCRCRTQKDCGRWQEELTVVLQSTARGRSLVPTLYQLNFPDVKILDKYNRPTVSTDEQLRNLRGLRGDWDTSFDELKLLDNVTGPFFNYWGKRYMNWVGPILLTRALIREDAVIRGENVHAITPIKQRGKKESPNSDASGRPLERKLKFSPFQSKLTSLEQKHFEGKFWNENTLEYQERDGAWTGERADPFEPDYQVECEIPSYWLQKSLPPEIMDPPPAQSKGTPASQKRKRKENDCVTNSTSETPSRGTKRVRKPRASLDDGVSPLPSQRRPPRSLRQPPNGTASTWYQMQKTN
jgi:Holliday junction resolvase YEN1